MIKGMGASRAGMSWEQTRTEVIGNNLANINTDGFKRSTAVGAEFARVLIHRLGDQSTEAQAIGDLGHGAIAAAITADLTQGELQQTDQPLDAALVGPGEFTFQTPQGPGYTRSGSFRVSAEGILVTAQGFPVLVGGAPVMAPGRAFSLREDGALLLDGEPAGFLDLRGADPSTRLAVGALERSNVDLSREMTDLITALRSFQVNQRALQMQDQTLQKAVTELGNL